MKKVLLMLVMVFGLVSELSAAGVVVSSGGGGPTGSFVKKYIVSEHYYEFDSSLNPNGYFWCGHFAYKTAVEASLRGREEIVPNNLHQLFLNDYYYSTHQNCYPYNKQYCASFQNLEEANNYYGFYSSHDSYPSNYSDMFSQVKSSIDNGYPVVTPWPYIYSDHFWAIVGYYDHSDNTKDLIYLRDVAMPDGDSEYDRAVNPHTFWTQGYNNGGGSMRLLFINTD
jgi:hypothetical protein